MGKAGPERKTLACCHSYKVTGQSSAPSPPECRVPTCGHSHVSLLVQVLILQMRKQRPRQMSLCSALVTPLVDSGLAVWLPETVGHVPAFCLSSLLPSDMVEGTLCWPWALEPANQNAAFPHRLRSGCGDKACFPGWDTPLQRHFFPEILK